MEQSHPWEANRFSASQEIPTFHGTRRFITAFTSGRHLSLSWARSIQYMPSHPTSWRSILRVSSHLHLGPPSGVFPSGFPTQTLYTPLLPPYVLHDPPVSFFSISTFTLRHSKSYNNYCALSQCFADPFLFRKITTDPPVSCSRKSTMSEWYVYKITNLYLRSDFRRQNITAEYVTTHCKILSLASWVKEVS